MIKGSFKVGDAAHVINTYTTDYVFESLDNKTFTGSTGWGNYNRIYVPLTLCGLRYLLVEQGRESKVIGRFIVTKIK